MDAYLDIETTGLSRAYDYITVIGIYLVDDNAGQLIQLVGGEISADNLLKVISSVSTIFTYNGSRFDLPFIHSLLGLDLERMARHHDLMYDCWQCNLYGGLKRVEQQLDIPRQLKDINGWEAVVLWQRYRNYNDQEALRRLLEYNKEDVINLKALRERLGMRTIKY